MLYLACDHAGFDLKQKLVKWLEKKHIDFVDCGAKNYDALDSYVDNAKVAIEKFEKSQTNQDKILLICGSGVGMSIVANRNKNVRAVLAYNSKQVKQARQHNDANCLCIGARNTCYLKATKLIKIFLNTKFLGGKYKDRIESI